MPMQNSRPEARLHGLVDNTRERNRRAGHDGALVALHRHAGELVVEQDDATVIAVVGDKDVGSLPKITHSTPSRLKTSRVLWSAP